MRKKIKRPKIYTAGPLGFSEVGRAFHNEKIVPMLERIGYEVLDPWKLTPDELILPIIQMPFGEEKRRAWRDMNLTIGRNNAEAIFRSDVVFAELDGVDVDSGTEAEVGFVGGMNMCSMANISIVGYRGDFRLSADNIGSTVNLQVEYFIRSSGCAIHDTLASAEQELKRLYEQLLAEV